MLAVDVVIPVLAVTVTAALLVGVRRTRPQAFGRVLGGAVVWWAVCTGLATSGVLATLSGRPPPLMVFMVAVLLLGVGLGRSAVGGALATLPLPALVLAQSFRLPLEVAMHQAAEAGLMPVALSWSGYNFDVVTGVGALLVGLWAIRGTPPAWVLWTWNLVGIAALVTIVIIAVLTSPMVAAFGPEQLNTWVMRLPYVWLPGVLVCFAVTGQVVVTRGLWARRTQNRSSY